MLGVKYPRYAIPPRRFSNRVPWGSKGAGSHPELMRTGYQYQLHLLNSLGFIAIYVDCMRFCLAFGWLRHGPVLLDYDLLHVVLDVDA